MMTKPSNDDPTTNGTTTTVAMSTHHLHLYHPWQQCTTSTHHNHTIHHYHPSSMTTTAHGWQQPPTMDNKHPWAMMPHPWMTSTHGQQQHPTMDKKNPPWTTTWSTMTLHGRQCDDTMRHNHNATQLWPQVYSLVYVASSVPLYSVWKSGPVRSFGAQCLRL